MAVHHLARVLVSSVLFAGGTASAASQSVQAVFAWGLGGDHVWSGAAGNALAAVGDDIYFTRLGGYSALNQYNADFATSAGCAGGAPPGATLASIRKYGCRYALPDGTQVFGSVPVADAGPLAMATGTLEVSETRITGTLIIEPTTDERPSSSFILLPNGVRTSNSIGDGTNGYNYWSEDPLLGNAWYGVTLSGFLEVDLTGLFTVGESRITGGTVRFTDGLFACQQGSLSSPANALCTPSTVAGGFQANGAHLSWGWDPDGAGSGTSIEGIEVRDGAGAGVVSTLNGVRADARTFTDYYGDISLITLSGEFRRALADASCGGTGHIRWDGAGISCGTLFAGRFGGCIGTLPLAGPPCDPVVLASGVPLPAAGWLTVTAGLFLPAFARRRRLA